MCEQEKETYSQFRERVREIADENFVKRLAEHTVDASSVQRKEVVEVAVDLFEVVKDELSWQGMLQPKVTMEVDEENMQSASLSIWFISGDPRAGFGLKIGDHPPDRVPTIDKECWIIRWVRVEGRDDKPERYCECHSHKTVLAQGMMQEQLLALLQDIAAEMSRRP